MVPPGLSSPRVSASATTARAIRSLTLRPGLLASTFTQMVAGMSPVTRLSRIRGVLPTLSSTLARILDIFHLVAHKNGLYFRDNSLGCRRSSRFERFYTDGHEKMVT